MKTIALLLLSAQSWAGTFLRQQDFTDIVFPSSVTILGPLLLKSTLTVQGNAFSVGGASFTVSGGSVTTAYRITAGSFAGDGSSLTGVSPAPGSVDFSTITTQLNTKLSSGPVPNNFIDLSTVTAALAGKADTFVGITSSCLAGYYLSSGTWVNGITTGGGCVLVSAGGANPTGPAGGDLSGTYPNPLVSHVQDGAVDFSTITAQLNTKLSSGPVPNNFIDLSTVTAALATKADTFVGITSACPAGSYLSSGTWANGITTGGGCVVDATGGSPTGAAGGDLSGTYPNPLVSHVQPGAVDFSTITTALAGKANTFVGITSSCASGFVLSTGSWANGITTGGTCVALPAAASSPWVEDGTVVKLSSPTDNVVIQSTLTIQGQNSTGFSLSVSSGISAQCITLQGGQVCGPSAGGVAQTTSTVKVLNDLPQTTFTNIAQACVLSGSTIAFTLAETAFVRFSFQAIASTDLTKTIVGSLLIDGANFAGDQQRIFEYVSLGSDDITIVLNHVISLGAGSHTACPLWFHRGDGGSSTIYADSNSTNQFAMEVIR